MSSYLSLTMCGLFSHEEKYDYYYGPHSDSRSGRPRKGTDSSSGTVYFDKKIILNKLK